MKKQPVIIAVPEYRHFAGMKILKVIALLNVLIFLGQDVDIYRKIPQAIAGFDIPVACQDMDVDDFGKADQSRLDVVRHFPESLIATTRNRRWQ